MWSVTVTSSRPFSTFTVGLSSRPKRMKMTPSERAFL
jgi:hypothetical protein